MENRMNDTPSLTAVSRREGQFSYGEEPPGRSALQPGHLSKKSGRPKPPACPYREKSQFVLPASTKIAGEQTNWLFKLAAAWPTLMNAPGAVC